MSRDEVPTLKQATILPAAAFEEPRPPTLESLANDIIEAREDRRALREEFTTSTARSVDAIAVVRTLGFGHRRALIPLWTMAVALLIIAAERAVALLLR
jgi:hypothetical protein